MAKLATDILAIKDMINSFQNKNIKVEDIFKIINKNEALFLSNPNIFGMDFGMEDFFDQEDDEFDFDIQDTKGKKRKRYLN